MLVWFDQIERLNGTNHEERCNTRERFTGWPRIGVNSTVELFLSHEFEFDKEHLLKIIIELNCYFLSLPCIKRNRTKWSPCVRRSVFRL